MNLIGHHAHALFLSAAVRRRRQQWLRSEGIRLPETRRRAVPARTHFRCVEGTARTIALALMSAARESGLVMLIPSFSESDPQRTSVGLLYLHCTSRSGSQFPLAASHAVPLSEGRLGGTNLLRRDLARNIAAYLAFLPILLSLQEGLFFSLYLARFSRNQR